MASTFGMFILVLNEIMHKTIHMRLFIFILTLGFTHPIFAQSINQEASKVTFEIGNMRFRTVEGTFSGMSGTVQFNEQNIGNATFEVCIDAKSIDTGNNKRDNHLRKEDFFHVEKYPTICFQSKSIAKSADGFTAEGTLTMHGVSKTVQIPFTYTNKTFKGTLSLERLDYEVGPGSGLMVDKTVDLEIVCILQ